MQHILHSAQTSLQYFLYLTERAPKQAGSSNSWARIDSLPPVLISDVNANAAFPSSDSGQRDVLCSRNGDVVALETRVRPYLAA